MKKFLLYTVTTIIALFGFMGCMQEKLLFHPHKLPAEYKFKFTSKFEEINYTPEEDALINALHFKADSSKGIVLYFHGNAGALNTWGNVSGDFLRSGYDLLIIDYRGFGKSEGRMSEKALFSDAQFVYNKLKEKYPEQKITVYGRSIGTGIAAYIAANNNPGRLVLETPYYNMKDLVKSLYPIAPAFMLRYHLKTNEFLPRAKCPVYIFHGTEDEVIYYGSSLKLKELFKSGDTLITVPGGMHNNLDEFKEYRAGLEHILK